MRLDETRAVAATITRKRAVLHNCLGYAAELGLLEANPLDRITWRTPRSSFAVDPRSAATPAEPGQDQHDRLAAQAVGGKGERV